ncbi:MAG: HAMP domain-containing histidine kinase [archaeon]|nr:HAMP domain-containing histidine kinase [archaeon]
MNIILIICLLTIRFYEKYEIQAIILGILLLTKAFIITYFSHDISRDVPMWGVYPVGAFLVYKNKIVSLFWIFLAYIVLYYSIRLDSAGIFSNIHTTLIIMMLSYGIISYVHSYSYNQIFNKLKKTLTENRNKQKHLMEMAHSAGKADIATDTLHNVGNILNSIMNSAENVGDMQKKSSLSGLTKANTLLKENIDNLGNFIEHNPKGKKLLDYYLILEKTFQEEQVNSFTQLKRIQDKIQDIDQVIKEQESILHSEIYLQSQNITEVIIDVLSMIEESIKNQGITIISHFEEIPNLKIQKTKLINIITNIINNADDAMKESSDLNKDLHIFVNKINNEIIIKFKDSGCGIPNDLLQKIFSPGFSTKENANGFGLHICANYMTEMNGSISVESGGLNKGATFILNFPV